MQYYILGPVTVNTTAHNYLNDNDIDPLNAIVGELFYFQIWTKPRWFEIDSVAICGRITRIMEKTGNDLP